MKKVKVISIICLIFLIACKKKTGESRFSKNNSTASVSIKNQEQTKGCRQTFEEFFERFCKDSLFQKNRVKYPLHYYFSDYDYSSNRDTLGVELIQKKNYNYLDFTVDKDAMNNEYDKYTIESSKINNTSIHYKHLGYDNGIRITHKFKLIDGCWYMVEILDEST